MSFKKSDAPPPYSPSEQHDDSVRPQHSRAPTSPLPPLPSSSIAPSTPPPPPPRPIHREGKQRSYSGQFNTVSSTNPFFRYSDSDRNSSPNISHVDMESNGMKSSFDASFYSRYQQNGESSTSSSSSSPTIGRPHNVNRTQSMHTPIIENASIHREASSADLEYCHDEKKVQEYNKSNSKLLIKQSNSPLELKMSWTGAECQLKNQNGDIIINGSLNANKSIQLESNKGDIVIAGRLLATRDIYIKAINGTFDSRGESIIAKTVHIEHSNRPIQLTNVIEAKKITIKSSNAPIQVSNISVGSQLLVKTTNAAVEVFINDTGSNSVKIDIETSNAPVNVYVPNKYSGSFNLRSNNGLVTVVSKFADLSKSSVTYSTDKDSQKAGNCKNNWNKSKCSVNIKTTNAPATLYIQ